MSGRFFLLGADVSLSPTPNMVNTAFGAMGIDASYSSLSVTPGALAPTFSRLKAQGIRGLNVTMPHKISILRVLDSSDEISSKIGAVNTVAREGTAYRGYNTDVEGIIHPIRALGLSRVDSAAVIGTGGAARAFCAAMAELQCRQVTFLTRDIGRVGALVSEMRAAFPDLNFEAAQLLNPIDGEFRLIFNASPIGSRGVPLPASIRTLVKSDVLVFDAVYSPVETELIRFAVASGSHVVRGYEMLLEQAAGAIRIWTGRPPPMDAMKASLLRSLEVAAS
jgi:shikimate dehydrogenase